MPDAMDYQAITVDEDGHVFYRASALGHCVTALVAIRMGMQTMEPNQMFQDKFEDGHVHEDHILKKAGDQEGMRFFRLQPDQPQDRVVLKLGKQFSVVGHVDAIGDHPTHEICVVDAKALSSSSFESWGRGEFEAWPHYAWQQSAYAYALGDMRRDLEENEGVASGEFGVKGRPLTICMAVKNKNSSQVRCWFYPEPPISRGQIMAKLAKVEAFAAAGHLPECTTNDFLCPVWYLHKEKADAAAVLDMETRSRLNDLAMAVSVQSAMQKNAERVVKESKAAIAKILGVGQSTRLDAGRISVYKTKNPPRFDKDRFIEDHPGIDLDAYYTQGERTEVRVTPPKDKE